ncbi:ATP-binding cassette domain-containing protein [bacterium]|nr:ATP-binding cassette domain-containing protein [bacterium]
MIHADAITYTYPGSSGDAALRGVSFSMEPGERVALMGANGSGKTTLIRCLNGLFLPASGTVTVDEFRTDEPEHAYEVRRRVGMMFQNPDNQIVTTTVEREIAFGLENLGLPYDEMRERTETALIQFELSAYRDTPPHLLSGGERQRLALAAVWVMRPRYLILDEPTSLLDPRSRKEVMAVLERDMADRIGLLTVTQIPEEALACRRLVIMDRGAIVRDGSPADIFTDADRLRDLGLSVPVAVELESYLRNS